MKVMSFILLFMQQLSIHFLKTRELVFKGYHYKQVLASYHVPNLLSLLHSFVELVYRFRDKIGSMLSEFIFEVCRWTFVPSVKRKVVCKEEPTSRMRRRAPEVPMAFRTLRRILTDAVSSQSCRMRRITYTVSGPSAAGSVSVQQLVRSVPSPTSLLCLH